MAARKGILDNDEMIDATVEMLARYWPKSKIKQAIRQLAVEKELITNADAEADDEAGGLSSNTIQMLVARARQLMLSRVRTAKEDLRAQSLAVYQGIVQRQVKKDDRVATIAQARIDKVMGLEPQFNQPEGGDDLDSLRQSLAIEPQGATQPEEDDGPSDC